MDFDEYDYLEKSVENSETRKSEKKDSGEKAHRSSRHRDDEESREITESRSKKSRNEEQNEERKERDDRERSSRSERRDKDRHRSGRDVETESERYRDRVKEGGRDRERERENEKEREREREKRREREKEKESEREKERERSRRSSSHPRRDAEREIERERSRDKEARERGDSVIRDRGGRRLIDKKEVVQPEADPERDQRTVFAYQMTLKATERDVYEFFSKVGKVRDVRLIMDRNSRRSKGVGYIEFYDAMSVPMAIALSGHLLLGQPVMVKPSEAEKNLVQSTASAGGSVPGTYAGVARKLYVGNLHFNITEDQLRQVFEPFGPVELVQLPLDLETGQCKGFGFVQFAQLEHAKAAQSLNGKLEIAGRVIKVSAVTDHDGVQDAGASAADFDEDDEGGLSLNARSRAMLMQKLDRTGIATSIAGSLGVPVLNTPTTNLQGVALPMNGQAVVPPVLPALVVTNPAVEPVGDPSECLLLKNMFDPNTESEPDFDLDIKEEVQEECSNYGPVKHIYVDKNSAGYVHLRFDSVAAAASAQHAMHMRWFAGRLISATFMRRHEYDAKFGA